MPTRRCCRSPADTWPEATRIAGADVVVYNAVVNAPSEKSAD
jgi:hypothetical protein